MDRISVFLMISPERPKSNIGPGSVQPAKEDYDFSSVQVDLPAAVAEKVLAIGRKIKNEDLTDNGRESEPHATALYGLHAEDPGEVEKLLKGFGKVSASLGAIGLFETKDADVLKFAVESRDLARMNKLLRTLDHTNDYPDYQAHCTLAYLKKGRGKDYLGIGDLQGTRMEFDAVVFSSKNGKKTTIKL